MTIGIFGTSVLVSVVVIFGAAPAASRRHGHATSKAELAAINQGIIFIPYHKTGHNLVRVLIETTHKVLNLPVRHGHAKHRVCCPSFACPSAGYTSEWFAPDLALSPVPVPPCFAIVHMVRSPASWALSFYDYHVQDPTPEKSVETAKPVCELAHPPEYMDALPGLRAGWVGDAVAACQAIVERNPHHSILQHLRTLPETEGLRLAVLLNLFRDSRVHRNGLPAGNGDMMRAAANQVTIERRQGEVAAASATPLDSRARVTTIWMDETIGAPEATMTQLAAFLIDAVGEATAKNNASQVASLASQLLSDQAQSFAKASKGNHVTGGGHGRNPNATVERRARLIAGLEADPIFAEAFAWWRSVFGMERGASFR